MAKNVKNDFSDLAPHDILRLVANTALVAKEGGGALSVFSGKLRGQSGVMIWIPGWHIEDGEMNQLRMEDKND